MEKEQLEKRISELESLNDQLAAEIRYLNRVLKEIGFEEGIKTLKEAIAQIKEEDNS